MKKAVVLMSGGLDSTTTAAIARSEGFELFGLTVNYGQRHEFELTAARRVGQFFHLSDHKFINIDLSSFGGSALTADIPVPKDRSDEQIGTGVPITYVPARNTVLLSLALAYAETSGAFDIFLGVNSVDYSGYPDCREAFIESFQQTANLATAAAVEGKGRFRVHAPLMKLDKGQIIARGLSLGVDYSLTHSCYDPDSQGRSCGHCDACLLRLHGFQAAGIADPIRYQ